MFELADKERGYDSTGGEMFFPFLPVVVSLLDGMVRNRIAESGEYVFQFNGQKCKNSRYYTIWNDIMTRAGMNHTPHECRHTFRSRLDKAGANHTAINKIMGHAGDDIGERVYTHKTIQELKIAIELVTY